MSVDIELLKRMTEGLNNPELKRKSPGHYPSSNTMDELVAQLKEENREYVRVSVGDWVEGYYLFRWNDGKMFMIRIGEDGQVVEWYSIVYYGRS
jgi:hypothetical protein